MAKIQDRCSEAFQRNTRDLISPSILMNVSQIIDALRPLADYANAPITHEEFYGLDSQEDWETVAFENIDVHLRYDQDKSEPWSELDADHLMYETAREACEAVGLDPHQKETLEFWAVDKWLSRRLEANGENVQHLDGLDVIVWCRQTSGQSMFIDHVMEEISIQEGRN